MCKINFLTRWKIQLSSSNKKLEIVALVEIVDVLNQLDDEALENFVPLLLSSNISQSLSDIISFQDITKTCLISKIACHLSEAEEFFKQDFYLILKGFLRVMNSFPTAGDSFNDLKFKKDLFTCITLIMKRARERGCSFTHKLMPINTLLTVTEIRSQYDLCHLPALDFANLVCEILITIPPKDENDKKFRDQKMFAIIQNLKIDSHNLEFVDYFILYAKLIHNMLQYISSDVGTKHQNLIIDIVVDKFMVLMEYVLHDNEELISYEVFINLFYYILRSKKVLFTKKVLLMNRFFNLNGHNFLISVIDEVPQKNGRRRSFKSMVILSEVLSVFMRFTNNVSANDEASMELQKKCYNIVGSANIVLLKKKTNIYKVIPNKYTKETILLMTIISFIDHQWKIPDNRNKTFSKIALLLLVSDMRQINVNSCYFNMMVKIFTTHFAELSIQNSQFLQTSSAIILKSIVDVKIIDINFLKWWKTMGHPTKKAFNEAVIRFIRNPEDQFTDLAPSDVTIFEQKRMLLIFQDQTLPISMHSNVAKILCNMHLEKREYRKLLIIAKNLLADKSKQQDIFYQASEHQNQRLANVLDVIGSNNRYCDFKEKKATVKIILNILKKSAPHLKMASMQLYCNML